MTDGPHIVLAIESAIAGGSISLIRGGSEIANWTGTSSVSKAEELLVNIDEILTEENIDKTEIGLIAVSAGPGSFTGIRIGIATALGLRNGLGVEMASESALKAMAFNVASIAKTITAIPMGRNSVCLQAFLHDGTTINALDEPRTMPEDKFLSLAKTQMNDVFVLHHVLYERTVKTDNLINFGYNVAFAVGMICSENRNVIAEPLFISKGF